MLIIALPISLTLAAVAANPIQSQEPVGGWYRPNWDLHTSTQLLPQLITDCTGDGVEDLLLRYEEEVGPLTIRDGATGKEWYRSGHDRDANMYWQVQDLDGDGVADLFMREPEYWGTNHKNGRIQVVQGGSAALMWEVVGSDVRETIGRRVLLMDLTGDGVDDVVAFKHNQYVRGYSGKSGALLWEHEYECGRWGDIGPDLNQDQLADIVICGPGKISVIDSVDGRFIWQSRFNFPFPFAEAGSHSQFLFSDSNGDGISDVILIDHNFDVNPRGMNGAMMCVDGIDGTLLWAYEGSNDQELYHAQVHLHDATADGLNDLLLLGEYHQVLVDGANGNRVWVNHRRPASDDQFFEVVDLTGDGIPDMVGNVHAENPALVAVDGQTGQLLWRLEQVAHELTPVEFDGQPGCELIVANPRARSYTGEVLALRGSDGGTLWQHSGEYSREQLGWLCDVIPPSGMQPGQVLARTYGNQDEGDWAISYELTTGAEQWRTRINKDPWNSSYPAWAVVDCNGDGVMELLDFHKYPRGGFTCMNTQNGSIVNFANTRYQNLNYLGTTADCSGNHTREVVLYYGSQSWEDFHAWSLDSMEDRYTTGLHLSSSTLSVRAGGNISMLVEMPPALGGRNYQLLSSYSGIGPTAIDWVEIPLTPDYLFTRTLNARYPSAGLVHPQGVLDSHARARIGIQTNPGQLRAALIGRNFYFAVLVSTQLGSPQFCSGVEQILFTP